LHPIKIGAIAQTSPPVYSYKNHPETSSISAHSNKIDVTYLRFAASLNKKVKKKAKFTLTFLR